MSYSYSDLPTNKLWGNERQTRFPIRVVNTVDDAMDLRGDVFRLPPKRRVVGFDTEFDVKNLKASRVKDGELFCCSLSVPSRCGAHYSIPSGEAGGPPIRIPEGNRWFVAADKLHLVWSVLVEDTVKLVGSNLMGADRLVLLKHKVEILPNIFFDLMHASRVLRQAPYADHGLKALGKTLGYETIEFKTLFDLKALVREHTQPCLFDVPLRTGQGFKTIKPLVWPKHLPEKLTQIAGYPDEEIRGQLVERLLDYATLDAKMHLEGYYYLAELKRREQLEVIVPKVSTTKPKTLTALQYYRRLWHKARKIDSLLESRGIQVDVDLARRKADEVRAYQAESFRKFRDLSGGSCLQTNFGSDFGAAFEFEEISGGINPRSTAELPKYLYGTLGLPPPPMADETASGYWSTNADAVQWLIANVSDREVQEQLKLIQEIRRNTIAISQLDAIVTKSVNGRLHPVYKCSTLQGRLAASEPNVMQVTGDEKDPWKIRECYIAKPGHVLIIADESQLEARILASWMILLFGDHSLERDILAGDFHSLNVQRNYQEQYSWLKGCTDLKRIKKQLAGLRGNMKVCFYRMCFGSSEQGLAISLVDDKQNPLGIEYAKRMIAGIHNAYPSFEEVQKRAAKNARELGYETTITGRRVHFPSAQNPGRYVTRNAIIDCKAAFAARAKAKGWRKTTLTDAEAAERIKKGIRQGAARKASNTKTQGSGSEIIYEASVLIEEDPKITGEIVLNCHDELLVEAPEDRAEPEAELVKKHMTDNGVADLLTMPLDVAYALGKNWATGH